MFERVIAYEATCDYPPCPMTTEMYLPRKYGRGRMAQARKSARSEGWLITDDDHAYCPNHVPEKVSV